MDAKVAVHASNPPILREYQDTPCPTISSKHKPHAKQQTRAQHVHV